MSDDNIPDPQRLLKLAKQTMSSAERRKKYNKISFMGPSFWYPSQMAFMSRSQGDQHQRILTGGNQTGKTTQIGGGLRFSPSSRCPAWRIRAPFSAPTTMMSIWESSAPVPVISQCISSAAQQVGSR